MFVEGVGYIRGGEAALAVPGKCCGAAEGEPCIERHTHFWEHAGPCPQPRHTPYTHIGRLAASGYFD